MKIAHLNVRSLLSNFNSFKSHILEHNYDVVAVTETWLNSDLPDNCVEIDGYNFIRNDRESRGGGVGIYIKNSFKFKVVTLNYEIEQLWLNINIDKQFNVLFGNIYRPPKSNFLQFHEDFDNIISTVSCMSNNVICVG